MTIAPISHKFNSINPANRIGKDSLPKSPEMRMKMLEDDMAAIKQLITQNNRVLQEIMDAIKEEKAK